MKNVLNYKKPAFWLIVVAVVICIVVAVCFLTNPKKAPISLGTIQITWANALDMRPNEPTSYKLNGAELGELKDRLRDLEIGRKNNDYGGFTPMYSLSIKAQGIEQFMIASFNSDGTHVGLMYAGEYYRIEDNDFSRYLSNICAGGNRAEALGNKAKLSLDDVIMLSQKGEDLSWEDFEQFSYVETGSGLYIRVYEINPLLSLWIGGGNLDNEPMYISLRIFTEPEDAIDIRTEDVTAFISKHKDDLPEASISRIYRFNDSEDFIKTAEVVLNKDETFTFNFSPISSSLGHGTYKIDGNRLTLNTDDGYYTYVFDMVDDTLFDADASSEQVWFFGITDGSVFK